jgi:flagellar hook-basal body complex protein FliE
MMKIFSDNAFISTKAAENYQIMMARSRPGHLGPVNNPFALSDDGVIKEESFEQLLLKGLDGVSGAQLFADDLAKQAIINPDSVDAHDVTIAQRIAGMSLDITRNILSRLVQGWRDLINTR